MKKYRSHHVSLFVGLIVIGCIPLFLVPRSWGSLGVGRLFRGLAQGWEQKDNLREQEAEKAHKALQREISDFAKEKDSMPPAKAAAGWLALFDKVYRESADGVRHSFQTLSFRDLVQAIPGPAAWPELSRMVAERPAQAGKRKLREDLLKILIARLVGDAAGMSDGLDQMVSDCNQLPTYQRSGLQSSILYAYMELLPRVSRFQDAEVEGFRKLVDQLAATPLPEDQWAFQLSIPELVGRVEEKEAQKLILAAFTLPKASLEVSCGGQTLALVKRVALDHIDSLATAQWDLITSPDDAELFEKMSQKFPIRIEEHQSDGGYSNPLSYDRADAMETYVAGLVIRNEQDKAVNYVAGLDPRVLSKFDDLNDLVVVVPESSNSALQAFYEAVLKRCPAAPVRAGLTACILRSGDTDRVIQDLRKQLTDPNLPVHKKIDTQMELVDLYLAKDDVKSGLSIYRELLKVDPAGLSDKALDLLVKVGESAIELGSLLEDDKLVESGISRMSSAGREKEKNDSYALLHSYGWRFDLADKLIELHRFGEAERICSEILAAAQEQEANKGRDGRAWMFNSPDEQSDTLGRLIMIYNETGRFDKSVELLEKSPFWGKADLGAYAQRYGKLLYHVAVALHQTGRDDQALPILETYLYKSADYDPAYELLLDMKGAAALPMLDEIYSRDRFEERPLIWKAQLLKNQDKLEEAEKVIRQALKVDPTDGEEPAGDRVRAYAVLSSILKAEGNDKDAAFFADVVQSVRVAEKGDAYYRAGLILRGLKEYEKAESLFADAYCIQWRLAERLYSLGRVEEAKAHYEIAFKRLPEQFGRVASFCFGCEGVFASEHTRSIAERILLDLEKTTPERPQLHYLIGQLRSKQEQYGEAYAELKKAVELDPDYLDAWDMLSDLSDQANISQAERDAIQLKILSLDPLQRHSDVGISSVCDLAAYWRALDAGRQHAMEIPDSLLPLPASAEYQKKMRAMNVDVEVYSYSSDDDETDIAAQVVNDHIIDSISDLMDEVAEM